MAGLDFVVDAEDVDAARRGRPIPKGARGAVAWTFNTPSDRYRPSVET